MASLGTTYTMVSVPKNGANAGRPNGKKMYVILFRFEDVKDYERDDKGVKMTKFAMQEGKKPIAIYATPSTINAYHTTEGEDDAMGFVHHVDFEHPGSSLEFDEFVNNNANENLGAIVINCDGSAKIAGTPCQPLKLVKGDGQDNKEACKNILNLASALRGPVLGHIDKTLIPSTDNTAINKVLGLPDQPVAVSAGGV